jgi:glutamate/aspartate transport system substrate-binding protein
VQRLRAVMALVLRSVASDEHTRRVFEIALYKIYPIYDKWFNKAIPPNNTVLSLPVSYLLRDFWKYPTDQVPF